MAKPDRRAVVEGWSLKTDDERLTLIRNQVFAGLTDPLVIKTARLNVAHCDSRDEKCEINSIYYAVKDGPIKIPTDEGIIKVPGLRFVDDVIDRDSYPTAGRLLEWMIDGANGEDCDGFTILIATLLGAIGYQTGAVIVSRDPAKKDFTHIFPVVAIPKSNPSDWLPLDATMKFMKPGWLPPRSWGITAMKIYAFKPGQMKGRMLNI